MQVAAGLFALGLSCSIVVPVAAGDRQPEAVSLLGRPLYSLAAGVAEEQEVQLARARATLAADPDDLDALIWVGRRLGYLQRMSAAIEHYTMGLVAHPRSAAIYRHRGHRYISVRKFDAAVADLERATRLMTNKVDEVEQDGLPNARRIPLTTLGSNIDYHLALAHYLRGNYAAALDANTRGQKRVQQYDDNIVSSAYWRYLILRRLGQEEQAQDALRGVHGNMDIIENDAYYRLCLLYKGDVEARALEAATGGDGIARATLGYGLGMHHLLAGRTRQATEIFERIVAGSDWPAFGHIAAEVELARMRVGRPGTDQPETDQSDTGR